MSGEWGGPVRPEGDPSGWGGELDFKREVRARLEALETRNPLQNASIGAGGLVFRGDGAARSDDFEAGVSGWKVAGDSAEFNDITLRGGIIGNDALTNPVLFDGGGGAITNFALSTTHATLITVPKTVPEGCTKMASFCWGGVTAVNSRTVLDFVSAQVFIETFDGNPLWAPVDPSGNGGHTSASKYGILTGLTPGATVTHGLRAWTTGGDWAAHVSSVADLQLLLLWGR